MMNGVGRLGSFGLAAVAALSLTINSFNMSFHAARLAVVMVILVVMHLVRNARVVLPREALIYGAFLSYMLLELLWTEDRQLALNTIVPATDFVIILVLFVSFVEFHDLKAILAGAVSGFIVGAVLYTRTSGFPFEYPAEFSYNSISGMYLFGLVVTLLLASIARRKAFLFILAAAIGIHIVATTSIKTNVGVLLGALVAGAIHFGYVSRLIWQNALIILAAAAVLAFAIASNEAAVAAIERGTYRVALGIEILLAREELPGYTALETRANWQREGFRGWSENPVFGYGVEAFRSKYGITSHASHVDIAYNSGLIGLVLFYSLFASMFVRLYQARSSDMQNTRLIILGGTVCYLFMTFAGTIHYNAFLAAFLALGIGFLKRA